MRDNSVTTKNEMGFVVTHISVCLPVCFPRCDNVTTKTQKTKFCGEVCFLVVVALFVELVNTIRAWADAIRMSADSLIVFSNAIRIFLWGYKDGRNLPFLLVF